MSKNDDLKTYWSEDSGDEGSGKIIRVIRRDSAAYGRREVGTIFIPDKDTTGDGDHIIAHALLLYMIASFKGNTIRSMPETMHRTLANISPNLVYLLDEAKQKMQNQFDETRVIRKDTTAIMRLSTIPSATAKADETKLRLKSDTQNVIQEQLLANTEAIYNFLNRTIPKERKKNATIQSNLKRDGRERDAMNKLVEFNDLLGISPENISHNFLREIGSSGKTRGNIIASLFDNLGFTNNTYQDASKPSRDLLINGINEFKTGTPEAREYILTKVSECIFDLFDYVRTGKDDIIHNSSRNSVLSLLDDEKQLYQSLGTLVTIVFSVFKNLKKLPNRQQSSIYDKLLEQIIEKQGWGKQTRKTAVEGEDDLVIPGHMVVDKDGTEVELTKNILKERIAQFAKIDFKIKEEATHALNPASIDEEVEIRMLRNDETMDGAPFQYCQSRIKFIADFEATIVTPAKSSAKKLGRSKSTSGKIETSSSKENDLGDLEEGLKHLKTNDECEEDRYSAITQSSGEGTPLASNEKKPKKVSSQIMAVPRSISGAENGVTQVSTSKTVKEGVDEESKASHKEKHNKGSGLTKRNFKVR